MRDFKYLRTMATFKYVLYCFLLLLPQYTQGFLGNFFAKQKSSNDLVTTSNIETSTSINGLTNPHQSIYSAYNSSLEYRQETDDEDLEPSTIYEAESETTLHQLSSSTIPRNTTHDLTNGSVAKSVDNMNISTVLTSNGSTSKSSDITESTTKAIAITPEIETNTTSSPSEENEEEKVVNGKPTHIGNTTTTMKSNIKALYTKAVELISDTYTQSIILPVAAGVLFATTIILTIATCRCLKRGCRHRRMRRKVLPDSVKHLRPSDRARLLAESSDEEF